MCMCAPFFEDVVNSDVISLCPGRPWSIEKEKCRLVLPKAINSLRRICERFVAGTRIKEIENLGRAEAVKDRNCASKMCQNYL